MITLFENTIDTIFYSQKNDLICNAKGLHKEKERGHQLGDYSNSIGNQTPHSRRQS